MRCLNCQAVHTDAEIEMEDGCCPSCGSTYFDTGIEKDEDDAFFDDEFENDPDEDELKDFFDEGFFDDVDYDEDEEFYEDFDEDNEDEEDY